MIESILVQSIDLEVFRLVSYQEDEEFIRELELDPEGTDEILELLESKGATDSLEKLLDDPFRRKELLSEERVSVTRFSDGSFPVFYSSMEAATAEAEVEYWFTKFVGKPDAKRNAWYRRFKCDFNGAVKDLRPKKEVWPELTHDSDYGFCNKLGAEARKELDGLLAPSVRRLRGTNVPVFSRCSISNPRDWTPVIITCEAPCEET